MNTPAKRPRTVRHSSAPDADKRPLWEKMRAVAEGSPRKQELIESADKLEKASLAIYLREPPPNAVRAMLSQWAKSRRLYCDVTGDTLVPGLVAVISDGVIKRMEKG